MIVVPDVVQGSIAWHDLRRGIPTASRFDSILTEKTRKFSKAAESYAVELIAERILGFPLLSEEESERATRIQGGLGGFVKRGQELEDEGRRWYAFNREVEVLQVGFVYTDDRQAGCSPDGLVEDDGLVEIKSPSAKVHIGHLLGRTDPASITQVQGQLWVTGRQWCDVVSHCPGLPPVLLRFQRNEEYLELLGGAIKKFQVGLETALRRINGLGVIGRVEGFGGDDNDSLLADLYGSVVQATAERVTGELK